MAFQKRRLGCVRPCSQFLRVPRLMPSFAAKVSRVRIVFNRQFLSSSASDWLLFCEGGESTLMDLITRWQKGFKNHPFRHLFAISLQDGTRSEERRVGDE